MNDMKLMLHILANSSGMKTELTGAGRSVHRFTQGAKQEFQALRASVMSLQGSLAGLGLSIGMGQLIMDSARLDKSLVQISQTAGVGAAAAVGLRSELFGMAKVTGQSVENLRDGFSNLVQSGLSMREARTALEGINIAMAVTGANAQTLSAGLTVAGQAFQFDLAKPGQALELLDKMTVAGRLGNAELQNLSDIFARVGVNANSAGLSFGQTLAFIEGLSLVERQPERLATLADSTLRVFTNMQYMATAQRATGIKFYDKSGSRRDPMAVLKDIKQRYDTLKTDLQRDSFVQAAFGKSDLDTIKGIKTLLQSNSLSRIGTMFGIIDKAGGTLNKDLPDAMNNLVDQAGRLGATLREGADGFVKPIKDILSQMIGFTLDGKDKGGLGLSGKDIIKYGALGTVGTLVAAKLGSSLGKAGLNMLRGGANVAAGVAEGKVLQYAAGVTPVFVVNMPGGGLAAGNSGPAISPHTPTISGQTASSALSLLAMAGPYALPPALVGGAIAAPFVADAIRENGWNSRAYGPGTREHEVMGISGARATPKTESDLASTSLSNLASILHNNRPPSVVERPAAWAPPKTESNLTSTSLSNLVSILHNNRPPSVVERPAAWAPPKTESDLASTSLSNLASILRNTWSLSGGEGPAAVTPPKNEIKVDIRIDEQGRQFITTNDLNSTARVAARGDFFSAITRVP